MRRGNAVSSAVSEVLCITDDVQIAAAVSQVFASRSAHAPVRFVSSSELVFMVMSPTSFVVVGCDALAFVHQRIDAIVTHDAIGPAAGFAPMRSGVAKPSATVESWVRHEDEQLLPSFTEDAQLVPRFVLPDDEYRLLELVRSATSWIDAQQAIPNSRDVRPAAVTAQPVRVATATRANPTSDAGDGVRLISVANCSASAGASTVAWVVALACTGFSVLIDGDSRSAGLDLWIQAESEAASRWPDVAHLAESVSRRQVESALITVSERCSLLSHGRETVAPSWAALTSIRSGLSHGDLIVVDHSSDTSSEFASRVLAAADDIVIVVSPTVSSCAAAGKLMSRICDSSARTVLAVRGRARELSESTMRATLNPRHILQLPEDRRVNRALHDRRFTAVVSQRWRESLSGVLTVGDIERLESASSGRPARRRLSWGA